MKILYIYQPLFGKINDKILGDCKMENIENIAIAGRHIDLSPKIQEHAKEICLSICKKYSCRFLDVKITVSKESYLLSTDIHIKTQNGYIINSSDKGEEVVTSIERAFKKVDSILSKKKNMKDRRNDNKVNFEQYITECDFDDDKPIIIAEIMDDVKELSVSKAAEQLSIERKIFVFKNVHTKQINVVYIRTDGNIGWIDMK